MKKLFFKKKLIIFFMLSALVFLSEADNLFADKLQFSGFSLQNNPVNIRIGQAMRISGTLFYFTAYKEPKPVSVEIKIGGEMALAVDASLVDEKIIDEETQKKMQEWSFSADWDGKAPFEPSSGGVYECSIKAWVEGEDDILITKSIRVGIIEEDALEPEK